MYKQVSFPASDPIGESLAKHGMKRSKVRRSQRRLSARSTLLIRITSRRALLRHHGRQHRHHQSHHKRSPYRVQDGASHRQVDVGHDHAQGGPSVGEPPHAQKSSDIHAKGPGFIPRALGRTIGTSLDITYFQRNQCRDA